MSAAVNLDGWTPFVDEDEPAAGPAANTNEDEAVWAARMAEPAPADEVHDDVAALRQLATLTRRFHRGDGDHAHLTLPWAAVDVIIAAGGAVRPGGIQPFAIASVVVGEVYVEASGPYFYWVLDPASDQQLQRFRQQMGIVEPAPPPDPVPALVAAMDAAEKPAEVELEDATSIRGSLLELN